MIFLCPTLRNRHRSLNFFPRLYAKNDNQGYFQAQMHDTIKHKFQGNPLKISDPCILTSMWILVH